MTEIHFPGSGYALPTAYGGLKRQLGHAWSGMKRNVADAVSKASETTGSAGEQFTCAVSAGFDIVEYAGLKFPYLVGQSITDQTSVAFGKNNPVSKIAQKIGNKQEKAYVKALGTLITARNFLGV